MVLRSWPPRMAWAVSLVPTVWASSGGDERTRPPALREAGGKGRPAGRVQRVGPRAVGPPCLRRALWRKVVRQVPPRAMKARRGRRSLRPPVRLPLEVEVSHPARPRGRPDWAPTELRSAAKHPASPEDRSRIAILATPRAFQLQYAVVWVPRTLEEHSPAGRPPMARALGRSGDSGAPLHPPHQEPKARGPPDWVPPSSPFQLWTGQMR